MTMENLDLEYSAEELRDFIEKAVAQNGTQNQPRFYAITGSHIYMRKRLSASGSYGNLRFP